MSMEINYELEALLRAIHSQQPDVQRKACKQLVELDKAGDPSAKNPIMVMLKKPDPVARINACIALSEIGGDSVLPPLIQSLKDEDYKVRTTACHCLGKLENPRAIAPLIRRLNDSHSKTREAALNALEKLGDGKFARAVLYKNHEKLIQIAQDNDPRAIDILLEIISTPNEKTAKRVKRALIELFESYKPTADQFLCLEHFTRYAVFTHPKIKVSVFSRLPYFACRVCGKTLNTMTGISEVIAVLDSKMKIEGIFDDGIFEVNYLMKDELFDFDKVHVKHISDIEFETFCKKLAKNKSNLLAKKCSSIDCVIGENCGLSERMTSLSKNIFKNVSFENAKLN